MLGDVESGELILTVGTQTDCMLDCEKYYCDNNRYICGDRYDAESLNAEQLDAAAVEQSGVGGDSGRGQTGQ